MQRSTERFLTTHTGSFPRPSSLQDMLYAQEKGTSVDKDLFEKQAGDAVNAIVHLQALAGIDIINDGEMSKATYNTYVKDRLTGFEGTGTFTGVQFMRDLLDYPEYMQSVFATSPASVVNFPPCSGPITYTGLEVLQRDLTNLQTAAQEVERLETFMTAASPGIIALNLNNQYYPGYEEYLYALADAMKTEYDAIYHAGLVLQLDCPDLPAISNEMASLLLPGSTGKAMRQLHIEVLNHATRDIPADRMRLHVCWGNYEGPHHYDPPLTEMIGTVLQARPAGLLLEAANPRHAHEWKVFEDVQLPEGKVLIPGVLDTTTNFIEHPELVAQSLLRFASLVGKENVIAGTDCGFATFAGQHWVNPRIVWAKLQSLVEGARLASLELW